MNTICLKSYLFSAVIIICLYFSGFTYNSPSICNIEMASNIFKLYE